MTPRARKPLRPRPTLAPGARTIGIDPSLTSTGIAIYSDTDGWRLGSITSSPDNYKHKPPLRGLIERLDTIADHTETFVNGWRPDDLVLIEGYLLMQTAARGAIIANWHTLVSRLVHAGLDPIEIPPATRQTYATGGTRGGKDQVMAQAYRRFPQAAPNTNDEADALFLAALGRELTGHSIEPKPLPHTHLTAHRLFQPLPSTPQHTQHIHH